MAPRRGLQGPPVTFLVSGDWPDGAVAPGAPVAVTYAVDISRRLGAGLEGRSISEVCRDADLARSTVQDVLAGRTWPDVVTLAKLEVTLGVRLWPDRL